MALSLVTPPALEPLTIAEVKKHLRVIDTDGEPSPTAPTVALAGAGAGNCDNGAWRLGVTFVTADGETELGILSAAVTVVDKTVNGKLAVSNLAIGGSAVTARNLYAIPPLGTAALYAGQVANNSDTTATVNIAASGLGVQAPSVNTTADPELVSWITSARQFVENFVHRALMQQTWDYKLDAFPCDIHEPIWVPLPPLLSVTSITYVDANGVSQTWDSAQYTVDKPSGDFARAGRIVPVYQQIWPITRNVPNAVTVRMVAGYGAAASTVPAAMKSAMKLLIGNWWQNREAGAIVRASADVLPFGVEALLWPFKAF